MYPITKSLIRILNRNFLKNFQAQNYDPEGEYVAYWLPQLKGLPKERRNFPGRSYIEQIVPLKHGNINHNRNQNGGFTRTGRRDNFRGKHAQVNR